MVVVRWFRKLVSKVQRCLVFVRLVVWQWGSIRSGKTGPSNRPSGTQVNDARIKDLNECKPQGKVESEPLVLTVKQSESGLVLLTRSEENKKGAQSEDQERKYLPERRGQSANELHLECACINGLTKISIKTSCWETRDRMIVTVWIGGLGPNQGWEERLKVQGSKIYKIIKQQLLQRARTRVLSSSLLIKSLQNCLAKERGSRSSEPFVLHLHLLLQEIILVYSMK